MRAKKAVKAKTGSPPELTMPEGPVIDISSINNLSVGMIRGKRVTVATTIDTQEGEKTVYIYQATIGEDERIRNAPNDFEASRLLAKYLAESSFNDAEGTRPIGTYEEFKDNLSSTELMNLFIRLKDGIKKKKG